MGALPIGKIIGRQKIKGVDITLELPHFNDSTSIKAESKVEV
jgi:hypothetical protein